ncbi:MAG: hypothetical protein IKA41_05275, partial [Bacteroidaceae bacterium]|nr:hypothetical protein [Bacteroidaceae bacterium]
QYGEGIVVKGGVNQSTYPGAWVGVYQKGKDHKSFAPEYIIPIGSNFSPNYNGSNRWIVHATHSLVNKNMELEAGDYTVKLMSTENPMTATVLCSADFSVKYSVAQTDKTDYGYGEDIISYANVYNKSDANIQNTLQCTGTSVGYRKGPSSSYGYVKSGVALYPGNVVTLVETSGAKIVSNQGYTCNNWAHIKYSTYDAGYTTTWLDLTSNSDVKIYGTLTTATYLRQTASTSGAKVVNYQFPIGTPFNFLEYESNSFIKAQIGGYTGYIYRESNSTAQILQTYRLHDTSGWPTYDSNARAALYPSSVTPASGVTNNGYYYLNDAEKSSMTLQDCGAGAQATPAGNYTFRLFGANNYTIIASKDITISSDVTGEFARGAYEVENLDDGFANGRVAFEIDKLNDYGYVGNKNTYAAVYWAGSDGKPLAGYSSFYKAPLDKNIISFDMAPYSIIPEGATGLVAYVEFDGVKGEGKYIALPEGCKTYTGLNEGILTEFQVLADTKLGDATAQYPSNNAHYKTALEDIAKNSATSQFVFINGDVTRSGTFRH